MVKLITSRRNIKLVATRKINTEDYEEKIERDIPLVDSEFSLIFDKDKNPVRRKIGY